MRRDLLFKYNFKSFLILFLILDLASGFLHRSRGESGNGDFYVIFRK